MNTKIEVKTDKDPEAEKAIQDEESPVEKSEKPDEKPLEEMTKSELLEKINELQEASEKNHDLYLRSEAEIENIKKRNRKDKEEWVKYANETLIKEILPVMDNLEMAISHSQDENSIQALREGVELTLKGLRDVLGKSGLEEVKAESEPFDPNYHHAVSEQADENVEAGIILQELQKGYMLKKRLIRPAMVIVSKGSSDGTADDNEG
ncbi:MAG: nucleotide exchange factor GrpE [Desulfobacteraceae bacterium]|jgi:molecular chaperone GrpE